MSEFDHNESGHDSGRRKALGCLAAWTGAAVLWNVAGGVPRALGMTSNGTLQTAPANSLTFVQISDTHIGFNKPANPDVVGSLRRAIADINALPQRPAFVVHTGDISHLSRAISLVRRAKYSGKSVSTACTPCPANTMRSTMA